MESQARKPKLLFVVHSLTVGGAEKLVIDMSGELESDYKIAIVALDKKGALWDICERRGYSLFCLERQGGVRLGDYLRFSRYLETLSPDLIHAHQYTPLVFSSFYKAKNFQKTPLLFTEHGRHYPDVVSAKRRFANKFISKYIDVTTCVSEFSKESLIKNDRLGFEDSRVIYNGLYPEKLEKPSQDKEKLRLEMGATKDDSLIAYLGSLRPVKNPMLLLEAFSELSAKPGRETIRLAFVGDGPLRGELEEFVKAKGLEKKVRFLGAKVPASPWLSGFDVFVQPSIQEACSLALLEAMEREIPVLVSRGGGGPELVGESREFGLLFSPDSKDELIDVLEETLDNWQATENRAKSAKIRVEQEFSWSKMMGEYRDLYTELLERRRS